MNTLNSVFDKILCINRKSRRDRRESVVRQCEQFGIKLDWFEAHEADNCLVGGKPNGNFGCTASHRGCLELQCFHRWKTMLVLEDDFQIVHDDFVSMFDSMWPDIPEDWDFVFLGAGYAEDPIARVNDSVIRAGRLLTTSSYAITCAMARKIAPHIYGSSAIDSLYFGWQREAKTYVFSPRLMVQADGVSDLTGQFSRNSNSMLDTAHENRLDGTHLER